jgi:hypothetical protein
VPSRASPYSFSYPHLLTKKTVPLKAILALVQYLEVDERKHFERMSYAGEGTSNHVFNDIRIVSDWLDQQPGIPSAAERERRRLTPIEEAFANIPPLADSLRAAM